MKRNVPDKHRNPTLWFQSKTRGCDCKLVVKKATVYRSQDDKLTVNIYPNLPK